MKFLLSASVLLGIQQQLQLVAVVDGCTYLSKNKQPSGEDRSKLRGKKYNHQEGCYEHHGRLLQEGEVFQGTPEEAIQDAGDWICDMHHDDHHLGPKFVRLVFHDCVGGCDGCVAMSNDDNSGLEEPIEELEPLVEFYAPHLTRTDIWALSAVHFANMAGANTPGFQEIPFDYYGRPTCEMLMNVTDDNDGDNDNDGETEESEEEDSEDAVYLNGFDHEMPSAFMTTSNLIDFFHREFNFTHQEVVAIMGAHTLGHLDEDNSGFDAPQGWVFNHSRLDNGVFRLLVDDGTLPNPTYGQVEFDAGFGWMINQESIDEVSEEEEDDDRRKKKKKRRRNRRNKKRILDGHNDPSTEESEDDDASEEDETEEPEDEDDFIMLNVDMGLVLDLDGQLDDDGESDCSITECPTSILLPWVVEYAANEPLFLNDFRDVLTRVTLNGLDICTLNVQAGVPPLLECLDAVQSIQPSASPVDDSTPTTPSPSETPVDDGTEPEPCGIFRGRLCWQYWWE